MKFVPLLLISLLLFSCVSNKKIIAEFENLKETNQVSIIFDELKSVEVKSAMDVLFTRYINDAPEDDTLLKITNQFALYYLYEKGYQIIYEGDEFLTELKDTSHVYYIQLNELKIKEVKYKEEVKDTIKGTVDYVKLKGIETSLEGGVNVIYQGEVYGETERTVKAQESIYESQDGEFANTKNLKDVVVGNKTGSEKYLYEVNRLGEGLFEYQCQEVARILVDKIDNEIMTLYKKEIKSRLKEGEEFYPKK
jgi:hypothetical protein